MKLMCFMPLGPLVRIKQGASSDFEVAIFPAMRTTRRGSAVTLAVLATVSNGLVFVAPGTIRRESTLQRHSEREGGLTGKQELSDVSEERPLLSFALPLSWYVAPELAH